MTATRRFLLACATLLASSSFAQIMTLSGEVTGVSGVFAGQYASGDSVTLTIDLSAPLVDDAGGAFLPISVSYFGRFSASIGGTALILPGPTDVFVTQGPEQEGLLVDAAWEASEGEPGGRIFQAFYSEKNILDSFTYFPAGLALSEFANTAGFFANDNLNPTGRVDWEITSYTGFGGVQPFSPVPEPSTYAAFAAAGLCGLIVLRRRRARPRSVIVAQLQ